MTTETERLRALADRLFARQYMTASEAKEVTAALREVAGKGVEPSVPVSKLRELTAIWDGYLKGDAAHECADDLNYLIQQAESGEGKAKS